MCVHLCIAQSNQHNYCPVGWGCRIHQLLLCRGVRMVDVPLNQTNQPKYIRFYTYILSKTHTNHTPVGREAYINHFSFCFLILFQFLVSDDNSKVCPEFPTHFLVKSWARPKIPLKISRNYLFSLNFETQKNCSYSLCWAVWHSCRMGYRNQWQIRGRKAPSFGWATFNIDTFVPYV